MVRKYKFGSEKYRNTSGNLCFIGQPYNVAQNALENVESPADDEQTE